MQGFGPFLQSTSLKHLTSLKKVLSFCIAMSFKMRYSTPLVLWHSRSAMYDSGCGSVSRGGNISWKISNIIVTKNYVGVQAYAFKGRQGVVGVTVIISVKKLLEPLEEFKIVLETTLDKFIHRNDLYSSKYIFWVQKIDDIMTC